MFKKKKVGHSKGAKLKIDKLKIKHHRISVHYYVEDLAIAGCEYASRKINRPWYKNSKLDPEENITVKGSFGYKKKHLRTFGKFYMGKVRKTFTTVLRKVLEHEDDTVTLKDCKQVLFQITAPDQRKEKYKAKAQYDDSIQLYIILLNYPQLYAKDRDFYSLLLHEMMHFVAEQSHNQQKLRRELRELDKEHTQVLEHNRQYLDTEIVTICQKFLDGSFTESRGDVIKYLKNLIDNVLGQLGKYFNNTVADMGLGLIAIEYDDEDYFNYATKFDRKNLHTLEEDLDILHRVENNTIMAEPVKQKFFSIFQYLTIFFHIPYHSLAWAALPNMKQWKEDHPYRKLNGDNEATKILAEFIHDIDHDRVKNCKGHVEILVKESCRHHFHKFFDEYMLIVTNGAIHDPTNNPNLKKKIHNGPARSNAKRAYKLLIDGYKQLVEDYKTELRKAG